MRLLTFSDGFGDTIHSPTWYRQFYKWPDIIKLMCKNIELVNLSRYGAGNEYIINALKQNYVSADFVIVQWALPARLDLVLDHKDDCWREQIAIDPVYSENIVEINNDQYWLSSASTNPAVAQYHSTIALRQHQIRSQNYVDYAHKLLQDTPYRFMLCEDSLYLQETDVNPTSWCWHDEYLGMTSFKKISRYCKEDADADVVQPISLVQFDFIRKYVQPYVDLPWRNEREILAVENMLYKKYHDAIINKCSN